MQLSKLLSSLDFELLCGSLDTEIQDLCYDSRKASPGKAFVALLGTQVDGHDYLSAAYENGARTFIVQRPEALMPSANITAIRVPDSRIALALMSRALFGDPAKALTLIGITGTKGKSSITGILKNILDQSGRQCGTIGTTGVCYGREKQPTINTTPESYETYRYLDQMRQAGCSHAVMEVSSQGLKMHRVEGICYDIGLFTNLSPDHIGKGEHESFEDYLYCKSLLFSQCKAGIANADDPYFAAITRNARCPITTFAIHKEADFTAKDIHLVRSGKHLGVEFTCQTPDGAFSVSTNVPGEFTVYNCLAAIAAARMLGVEVEIIRQALTDISVKGRMELVGDTEDYSIIIDYAHNAVSLQTILQTIRQYQPRRIVCLFGCGGNRPKMRRFEMGEIAGKYADFSILTADNSRFERTEDIIADILTGIQKTQGKYVTIPDRVQAIHYAIDNALPGDIILIAGKGHEMYQEMDGIRHPFNEAQIICDYLTKRRK